MAATLSETYRPDHVVTVHVVSDVPGHYLNMVRGEAEDNPLLNCVARPPTPARSTATSAPGPSTS